MPCLLVSVGWCFLAPAYFIKIKRKVKTMSLHPALFSAAIRLSGSVSHYPGGVAVQFASQAAFAQFLAFVAWCCMPHHVAVSGGVWSVAFGQLPAGGL
jgi:hypothetical protein